MWIETIIGQRRYVFFSESDKELAITIYEAVQDLDYFEYLLINIYNMSFNAYEFVDSVLLNLHIANNG